MDPNVENIRELNDIIWSICDEYSWGIPVHMAGKSPDAELPLADLTAAYGTDASFGFVSIIRNFLWPSPDFIEERK